MGLMGATNGGNLAGGGSGAQPKRGRDPFHSRSRSTNNTHGQSLPKNFGRKKKRNSLGGGGPGGFARSMSLKLKKAIQVKESERHSSQNGY